MGAFVRRNAAILPFRTPLRAEGSVNDNDVERWDGDASARRLGFDRWLHESARTLAGGALLEVRTRPCPGFAQWIEWLRPGRHFRFDAARAGRRVRSGSRRWGISQPSESFDGAIVLGAATLRAHAGSRLLREAGRVLVAGGLL